MTFQQRRQQVEDACAKIILAGKHVTTDDVAARTGLGRATLYRTPTYARSSKNTAPAAKKHTPSPGSPPRTPTSASRWTPSPPPCDATKKKSAAYESQKAANESLCSSEDLVKISRITMAQRLRRILQLPSATNGNININSFWSLAQARVVSDWKHDYNHHRRHSSLSYHPPGRYAAPLTLPGKTLCTPTVRRTKSRCVRQPDRCSPGAGSECARVLVSVTWLGSRPDSCRATAKNRRNSRSGFTLGVVRAVRAVAGR